MANFIPDLNAHSFISPGEKDFFQRLSRDEFSQGWVVLHSLEISHHMTRVMGEIDFLVIVPDLGILSIEIKAHEWLKVENGKWFLGRNDVVGNSRGPFRQVKESTQSLREYIATRTTLLSDLVIHHLVIFTSFPFETKSIEWHPSEFVSCREYRQENISTLLTRRLKKCDEFFFSKPSTQALRMTSKPSRRDMDRLIHLLRPSLEPIKSGVNYRKALELELTKFTSEQLSVLDVLNGNERVVVNGGGGTGKTLLAVESAIRAVQGGRRVLFLCMNRLLADFLAKLLESSDIVVESLHAHLQSYGSLPKQTGGDYWGKILPEFVFEYLLDHEEVTGLYDVIVLDEAQDIVRNDTWLSCLDLILREGLLGGSWWMFGDFDSQSIYGGRLSGSEMFERIDEFSANYTRARLDKNCRNLESVSSLSLALASVRSSPYKSHLRVRDPHIPPKYNFYKDQAEQVAYIEEIVCSVLDFGFKPDDIVILSYSAESKSCSNRNNFSFPLSPFEFGDKCVRHTSIYKFKGLEAPIVILTDFDDMSCPRSIDLLLTGASRSTETVFFLFNKKVERQLLSNFMER